MDCRAWFLASLASLQLAQAARAVSSDAGERLYNAYCSACHQASGDGVPGLFPPLKANGAVNKRDPTHHIQTVLFGEQGARVGGVQYPNPMPPFAAQLSDQEVANIVNYERVAWGNTGAPVAESQVAAVRAAPPSHQSIRPP